MLGGVLILCCLLLMGIEGLWRAQRTLCPGRRRGRRGPAQRRCLKGWTLPALPARRRHGRRSRSRALLYARALALARRPVDLAGRAARQCTSSRTILLSLGGGILATLAAGPWPGSPFARRAASADIWRPAIIMSARCRAWSWGTGARQHHRAANPARSTRPSPRCSSPMYPGSCRARWWAACKPGPGAGGAGARRHGARRTPGQAVRQVTFRLAGAGGRRPASRGGARHHQRVDRHPDARPQRCRNARHALLVADCEIDSLGARPMR